MDVVWKLNGNEIHSNMEVTTSRMGKRINVLMIDSVKAHHAGNYTCLAKNKAGQTDQSALLIVIGLFIKLFVFLVVLKFPFQKNHFKNLKSLFIHF